MVSDIVIGIMFFQDSRVAADNKNNQWQKFIPKIKMAAMNRKYIYNTCIFGCEKSKMAAINRK